MIETSAQSHVGQQAKRHPDARHDRPGMRLQPVLIACAAAALLSGCADETRQLGRQIRNHEVKTVVDQGLTLDREVEPAAVVFVLLQAVRDDYDAGDDTDAREAAFDRQLAVCAPDHIYSRAFRKNLGRDDSVQRIVWRWAPILGHYTDDFPKDWESGRRRLLTDRTVEDQGPSGPFERTRVLLELASPTGDPNASVVAQFQLVREKGYWRVAQVGYLQGLRHLTPAHLKRLGAKAPDTPG
ncbi:MAG: hypothetical protein V3W34_05495 [Phycisphaerae bacterium]